MYQLSKRIRMLIKRCACRKPCLVHCWPWQGYTHRQGYGESFALIEGQRERYVHRIVWAAQYGHRARLEVTHTCDHPPCCNPEHLIERTHAANMLDMVTKGRARYQDISPRTRAIYARIYDGTGDTFAAIGAEYGVSQPRVSFIKARLDRERMPSTPVEAEA